MIVRMRKMGRRGGGGGCEDCWILYWILALPELFKCSVLCRFLVRPNVIQET